MMTYNPPYYERLIENYGLRKTQDMYAFWGHVSMLPKVAEKLAPICQQIIERYNVKIRPLDKSRFLEEVKTFLSIYNRSLTNTWGFVPMSDARDRAHGQGPEVPHRAGAGHPGRGRRAAGRRDVRAARLQSADQGDRRPALPLRLHPPAAEQERDQENPPDLHERAAGVPDARPGPGAHARHRAQGAGMGHPGGRVLLGAGVEQLLPRGAEQGRGQDHQDLPRLRHRLRSGRGRRPQRQQKRRARDLAGGWKSGRSFPAAI